MIFNKRWFGIKGETIGEGKYAISVVRVQTNKDGHWQALNDEELERLLTEHNQNVYMRDRDRGIVHAPAHPKEKQSFSSRIKGDPIGKVIRNAIKKKGKKKMTKSFEQLI